MQCSLCQVGCATLPEAFICLVPLDDAGKFDWTSRSLHSSNRFRLARSTGLFETLSLESLTRFGTLSLESLTPPTPFFGSHGSDFHRPQPERNPPQETLTNPSDYPKCSGVAVWWQLCRCAWSLWRHSRAMRTCCAKPL